jgi:hypothetical protein
VQLLARETEFLKLQDQSAFVTGGRFKPNHNNNVLKPQKKEHKPMLTIRGEVTWQRDAETGEWKIRPAAENNHASPDGVARLDQSQMEFPLVPVLNRRTEFVTAEA